MAAQGVPAVFVWLPHAVAQRSHSAQEREGASWLLHSAGSWLLGLHLTSLIGSSSFACLLIASVHCPEDFSTCLQVTLQGGDELMLIAGTCYSFIYKPAEGPAPADYPSSIDAAAATVDSAAGGRPGTPASGGECHGLPWGLVHAWHCKVSLKEGALVLLNCGRCARGRRVRICLGLGSRAEASIAR